MIETIYRKCVDWAKQEDTVRTVILEGSRAREEQRVDRFSDYDINLYVTEVTPLFNNTDWIHQIHPVWAIEKNAEADGITTCLTIFEGGYGIDFKLMPAALLRTFVELQVLPDEYHRGYQVILDKDKLTEDLPKPALKPIPRKRPGQEEFVYTVTVFWFELFYLVKYLRRQDLWQVKIRDTGIKKRLLEMLEWHAWASHDWRYDTWMEGKNMRSWVDPQKWEGLFELYARFDPEDSWRAVQKLMPYFRDLAKETANLLTFEYPDHIDQSISQFILQHPPM